MKYTLYSAIVLIALLPTCAQEPPAAHLNQISDESNELTATALLVSYARNVDGLLRDLVDQMRAISEQVEAGELTALDAQALKLEIARVTIARLKTISAVYDLLILPRNDSAESASPSDYPAVARIALRSRRTVSVKELMQESAQ